MEAFEGHMFCILGKSCSGKDTLYKLLLADASLALKPLVTYTTRPIRATEVHGIDYFFVTPAALRDFEAEGLLIEERIYQTVHGPWHYATVADHQFRQGHGDYLSIVTLDAFVKLRDKFGADRVIPLYVQTEDSVLLQRALSREALQAQPNYKEVCRRFLADAEDFSESALEAAGIRASERFMNEDLTVCAQALAHKIKQARQQDV